MQHATGEVIVHFDDDDFYAPHDVRTMVGALHQDGLSFVKLLRFA